MNSSVKPDRNYRSHYDAHDLDISEDLTDTPPGYDSVLKLSHSSALYGVCRVAQGRENAVDINVCRDVAILGHFGGSGVIGDQVITVKGGSRDITIAGYIDSPRTVRGADVEIGNHSDQSYALTRRVYLHLVKTDGTLVRVRVGWAAPFSVELGEGCTYMFWSSMGLKAYAAFKITIRLLLRIKKGVKGPAWL